MFSKDLFRTEASGLPSSSGQDRPESRHLYTLNLLRLHLWESLVVITRSTQHRAIPAFLPFSLLVVTVLRSTLGAHFLATTADSGTAASALTPLAYRLGCRRLHNFIVDCFFPAMTSFPMAYVMESY